jgi:hypothetical protein
VADGKDPDHTLAPVGGVRQPIASHPELPQPFQLTLQWLAGRGLDGDGTKGGLDRLLDLGWEMANDLGDVGRKVDPPSRHYRARRLAGAIASPNTSS